jgi:hypothetical protein
MSKVHINVHVLIQFQTNYTYIRTYEYAHIQLVTVITVSASGHTQRHPPGVQVRPGKEGECVAFLFYTCILFVVDIDLHII